MYICILFLISNKLYFCQRGTLKWARLAFLHCVTLWRNVNYSFKIVHEGHNTNKQFFNCLKCGLNANTDEEFREHMRTIHPIKSELFKKYMMKTESV